VKELLDLISISCFVGESTGDALEFKSKLFLRLLLVRKECRLFATMPAESVNMVVSASFSASCSASSVKSPSPISDWELLLWWL
jgi:hypothetical protein